MNNRRGVYWSKHRIKNEVLEASERKFATIGIKVTFELDMYVPILRITLGPLQVTTQRILSFAEYSHLETYPLGES
jgi:hypothetical protein